ncbi:MAG: chloride channel protein [Lactobacillus sp.]
MRSSVSLQMVIAGAAAGLVAAFNAPLAARRCLS